MTTPSKDLIVLGLEWSVTTEDLKMYFEKFGEITSAEVKPDICTCARIRRIQCMSISRAVFRKLTKGGQKEVFKNKEGAKPKPDVLALLNNMKG